MDDIKRHEAERLKRQAEAEGEGGSSGGEGCADGPEALQEALEESTHRATALHVEAEVTKSAVLSHLYIYINDRFTKTGSGQTYKHRESTQKRDYCFSL